MAESAFGTLLAELRAARGWPQAKLAERAEVDRSYVSRLEAGQREPERETVLRLAEALALPLVERDRLLAAAGFRAEVPNEPLLAELAELLTDGALPPEAANDVRTLVRVAIQHGRRAQGRQP